MELKDRFKQHKTNFDPAAWQNFEQLRKQNSSQNKNKKSMNGTNVISLIGVFMLVTFISITGTVFYLAPNNESDLTITEKYLNTEANNIVSKEDKNSIANNENLTVEKNQDFLTILPKKEINNEPLQNVKVTKGVVLDGNKPNNNKSASKLKNENWANSKNGKAKINNSIILNDAQNTTTEINISANPVQPNTKFISSNKISINAIKTNILTNEITPLETNTLNVRDKVFNQNKVAAITNEETELSAKLKGSELIKASTKNNNFNNAISFKKLNKPAILEEELNNIIAPLPIITTKLSTKNLPLAKIQQLIEVPTKIYKNTLKLNINYIPDFYVYSSIPNANPVKIRGYFVDLDYRRRLNKLLSVGIGLGYSYGKDRNNPQLDTLDYVRNAHAHLRVQLFFLNNPNNRFFVKGGTGLSYMGRLLSYNIDELARGFRENKFYYMGFTLEAAYERNITPQLYIGMQVGLSSGNDGFAYPGVSVGYNF